MTNPMENTNPTIPNSILGLGDVKIPPNPPDGLMVPLNVAEEIVVNEVKDAIVAKK
jgi:hypothetical protein